MSTNFYDLLKYAATGIAAPTMTDFDKALAMGLAGGSSGTLHTLTGIPPLTFTANGKPLVSWSIDGNAQQTGTPSPDNSIMPEMCGVRTGNLFDKTAEPMVSNASIKNELPTGIRTTIKTAGNNRYTSMLLTRGDELLGKTLTISATITPSAANNGNIRFFWLDGRNATSLIAAPLTVKEGNVSGTFKIPNSYPSNTNGIAIVFVANVDGDNEVGDYVDYTNVMLNLGSTALPYEPYGYKIPVTCAGQTTPVYLGQTPTMRRVKKLVLDGKEAWKDNPSWERTSTSVFYFASSDIIDISTATKIFILSDRFDAATRNGLYDGDSDMIARTGLVAITIRVSNSIATTVADFKSYLAAQYAAGTPVTVWYVLATPETAIVNEPLAKIGDYADELHSTDAGVSIPTVKGNNTLTVDTELKPSAMTIQYRG